MNNAVDLTWARTPSFYSSVTEAGEEGLLACMGFVAPVIFELIKPYWEGYIQFNGKKTALYHPNVVQALLEETYTISLDGVVFDRPISRFPGTLSVHKIINYSEKSQNSLISQMSRQQKEYLIVKNIEEDLWALFDEGDVVEESDFETGNWTRIHTHQKFPYDFDLTEGLVHFVIYAEISDNEYVSLDKVAHLKDQNDIGKLMKLAMEFKKYAKNKRLDLEPSWSEGFDIASWSAKRKISEKKIDQDKPVINDPALLARKNEGEETESKAKENKIKETVAKQTTPLATQTDSKEALNETHVLDKRNEPLFHFDTPEKKKDPVIISIMPQKETVQVSEKSDADIKHTYYQENGSEEDDEKATDHLLDDLDSLMGEN